MQELKARIERMLAGEQKRREVALRFLDAAQEVITPACQEIYGDGDEEAQLVGGAWLKEKHPSGWYDDREGGQFYWKTSRNGWQPGFYFGYSSTPAEDARGPIFWNGIRMVVSFIDYLEERLQAQEKSRESLVEKIRERFGISG